MGKLKYKKSCCEKYTKRKGNKCCKKCPLTAPSPTSQSRA